MDWWWLAAALVLAAVLSWAACHLVRKYLGVTDAPDNVRKLQKAPVPTSGGIGFAAAAVAAGAGVWAIAGDGPNGAAAYVLMGAVLAMVLGFWDDRRPVPALVKLFAIAAIGAGMIGFGARVDVLAPWPGIVLSLPWVLAAAGSLAWIIVVMNAVNFMDGANGLAMGMGAIAATGLAICAAITGNWEVAVLSAALAGALVGFLFLNVPGKLFAGDAGALFTGATLAGLGLLLVRDRPELLLVPPLLLSPFLVDVLLTLVWRSRRGKALLSPHRDHAYQIALKAQMSHAQVSGIHAIWAFNAAAVAVVSTLAGSYAPTLAAILLIVAGVWVHRMLRRFGVDSGLVDDERATED